MGNKTFNARMVKYHINALKALQNKGEIRKITVTGIARRVGCTTNTLYKEFPKLIAPYMQSRKENVKDSPSYGTLEYFKMQYEKMIAELEQEKEMVRKLREHQMDSDMLMQVIDSLEEDKSLLIDKNKSEKGNKELSERLMRENALLRGQVLKLNKKIQEIEEKRH